jgi:hypothetical protein
METTWVYKELTKQLWVCFRLKNPRSPQHSFPQTGLGKPQKPKTLISSNGPWKTPEAHNTHFLKRALENPRSPQHSFPQTGLRKPQKPTKLISANGP